MAYPSWLPLTLCIGESGPFTVELTQLSSTLIGYSYFFFYQG